MLGAAWLGVVNKTTLEPSLFQNCHNFANLTCQTAEISNLGPLYNTFLISAFTSNQQNLRPLWIFPKFPISMYCRPGHNDLVNLQYNTISLHFSTAVRIKGKGLDLGPIWRSQAFQRPFTFSLTAEENMKKQYCTANARHVFFYR